MNKNWLQNLEPYIYITVISGIFFEYLMVMLAMVLGMIGLALRWQDPRSNK
jgi:hypothetical protein